MFMQLGGVLVVYTCPYSLRRISKTSVVTQSLYLVGYNASKQWKSTKYHSSWTMAYHSCQCGPVQIMSRTFYPRQPVLQTLTETSLLLIMLQRTPDINDTSGQGIHLNFNEYGEYIGCFAATTDDMGFPTFETTCCQFTSILNGQNIQGNPGTDLEHHKNLPA